jgi:hypothetical protein
VLAIKAIFFAPVVLFVLTALSPATLQRSVSCFGVGHHCEAGVIDVDPRGGNPNDVTASRGSNVQQNNPQQPWTQLRWSGWSFTIIRRG